MIDRAGVAAFAGVELAEHKLQAFQYAIQTLRQDRSRDEALESALRTVWGALYAECMEAYRKVFMWGSIVPDQARAEAKKIACNRFLHESSSIMQYLYPDGSHPSSWASKDREKFQKEIKALQKKVKK
jgi:hypothetical protein